MSPLPSALNTPAPQSRPNSLPISAAGSYPITPQISPTPSRNDIHGILPTCSCSSRPTEEEDQVMAVSSLPAEESWPKSGRGAKVGMKRSGEDVNGGCSKKARTSNVDTTTARGGKTCTLALIQPMSLPAQSIMETRRCSRRGGDMATKQLGLHPRMPPLPLWGLQVNVNLLERQSMHLHIPPSDHHWTSHLFKLGRTHHHGSPGPSYCFSQSQRWVRGGWHW